jgi:hypothetical protein
MGTGEFYYLCMVIGAMAVFAGTLAWGDWFSHRPPRRNIRQAGE